jgi:hypothetical protein
MMTRKFLSLMVVQIALLACLVVPIFIYAQGEPSDPVPAPAPASAPATPADTTTNAPGMVNEYSLNNPIKVDSVQELLNLILRLVIIIATPIVVLFIIFAGFKYVTARGDARQVEEATTALTYSVIGGVLIIGAVAIAEIIKDLVNSF